MNQPSVKPRIFVVEDEMIVARDIRLQLGEMGYAPVGHAGSADGAKNVYLLLRFAYLRDCSQNNT